MKAITLTQPWATLVGMGEKRIETRSWGTGYRGELAIHAAKVFPKDCMALCEVEPYRQVLFPDPITYLGRHAIAQGAVVAICLLNECVKIDELLVFASYRGFRSGGRVWRLTDQERAFGDYRIGRWAWLLSDVRRLDRPVPAKGMLGLWEWDESPLPPLSSGVKYEDFIEG